MRELPLESRPARRQDPPWPKRAATARALCRTAVRALVLGALLCAGTSFADGAAKEQMRSLDEQVQEIKSDVLGIAAELSRLEEKLLYPSNTQVAVFVELADGGGFRLDSVRIRIDGEPVAHHIYTFKELEALQKGGVQRLYTGNVAAGEHQLEVAVAGKRPGGGELEQTRTFSFRKEVEPKLVGITLSGQGAGDAGIQLGEW